MLTVTSGVETPAPLKDFSPTVDAAIVSVTSGVETPAPLKDAVRYDRSEVRGLHPEWKLRPH